MGSSGVCRVCGEEYGYLTQHYSRKPSHKPKCWPECKQCNERYKALGTHWRLSSCDYPSLSQTQREAVTGILMGDGTLSKRGGEYDARLVCEMTNERYLEYLDSLFGNLGCGVQLKHTANEKAKRDRESGFNECARAENYHSSFSWRSRSIPEFNEFCGWYKEGRKVWPKEIKLTPVVLKHWFCGDGHFRETSSKRHIKIALSNERRNREKVERYFERAGLPTPSRWESSTRPSGGRVCSIVWTKTDSLDLFDYMGDPVPGFEHKWPSC